MREMRGVGDGGTPACLFWRWLAIRTRRTAAKRCLRCSSGSVCPRPVRFWQRRATAEQREGMLTIFKGEAGPPWSILKNTFSTCYEPQVVHYETKLDGANSSVKAGDFFHLEMESIKNPVTGAEAFPGIVLPQGLLYKESTRASCKTYRASGKINYEYTGTDAAFSPFSWGSQ